MPLMNDYYQLDKTQATTNREGLQKTEQHIHTYIHTVHSTIIHDYTMQTDQAQIPSDNSKISSY